MILNSYNDLKKYKFKYFQNGVNRNYNRQKTSRITYAETFKLLHAVEMNRLYSMYNTNMQRNHHNLVNITTLTTPTAHN